MAETVEQVLRGFDPEDRPVIELSLQGCSTEEIGQRLNRAERSVRRLREGWRDRVPLHQLYPLLAHVVLFGGGYGRQTEAAAADALATL